MARKKKKDLAEVVALKIVHLWETECKRDVEFKPKKLDISMDITTSKLNSRDEKLLPYSCQIYLTATDKTEAKEAFVISAKYCLVYEFKEEYEASEQEFENFGRINVVFNAWPYIREYVQNTLARMNFGPLVLPSVTIGELREKSKKKN